MCKRPLIEPLKGWTKPERRRTAWKKVLDGLPIGDDGKLTSRRPLL